MHNCRNTRTIMTLRNGFSAGSSCFFRTFLTLAFSLTIIQCPVKKINFTFTFKSSAGSEFPYL